MSLANPLSCYRWGTPKEDGNILMIFKRKWLFVSFKCFYFCYSVRGWKTNRQTQHSTVLKQVHRCGRKQDSSGSLAVWSQGWGSLVGCRLWGRTKLDTTEATQQQQQQQLYDHRQVTATFWVSVTSSDKVKWKSLSHVWLFVIPWTILSMEFSRPECCSG